MRIPLYLRPGKDNVLIDYFKEQTEYESANHLARELMMDGLKYRSKSIESNEVKSIQPEQLPNKRDLSEIQITEKKVSKEELEKNLFEF